jgi:iron complex outermembrane receptor protein
VCSSDLWRLLANYRGLDDVETGLSGAGVLDPKTQGESGRFSLGLFYNDETFARDWGLSAELRYYHLDYTSGSGFQERQPGYTDAAGVYPDGVLNRMRSAERGYSLEVSGLYSGLKKHAIRLGVGYSLADLYASEQFINQGLGPDGKPLPAGGALVDVSDTPYVFAPERTRGIVYAFLQDTWTLAPDIELTLGGRYDQYSVFGGTFNPRAALVWHGSDRLITKLIYGKAFRAPSFLELYARTSTSLPNPDLAPEESDTWDLAFAYAATPTLRLGMDLYQFRQSNLIGTDSAKQYQNLGDRKSRGVELEAVWQAAPSLRLAGNLTRIFEDAATFPRSVPKTAAYLRADWAFMPRWNWNIQANWISDRPLPASDPRAALAAYTLFDTTLRYSPRTNWEFAASIRNLFDVDAREYSSSSIPDNLPLPGRGFHVELRHRF